MLSLRNVEVRYSEVILALRSISLEVPDGEIICLLGSNGAGKTTTLKSITGLLKTEVGKVTDGEIEFDGIRIEKSDPEKMTKMGIRMVMEGHRLFKQLSVEENLRLGNYVSGDGVNLKESLDRVCSYFPNLKKLYHLASGYLSGGEAQMLAMGSALMGRPRLMLLDEPSLGLAPILVSEIYQILETINRVEGTSMLLVEQNARAALSISKYGYVIENGRVVLDQSSEELKENEDVKEFYMGLSALEKGKSYRDVKHYKRRKRWLG